MQVLNAKVNMLDGSDNTSGLLQLLVDHIPVDFRFEAYPIQGGTFYWAELEGHVRFFTHTPKNQSGYGGHTFHIHMKDGTERDVTGPWSSSAEFAHRNFDLPLSVDVSITSDPAVFDRGHTFVSGDVLAEVAREAIEKYCPGFQLFFYMDRSGPADAQLDSIQSLIVTGIAPTQYAVQRTEEELCRFVLETMDTAWKKLHEAQKPLKFHEMDKIPVSVIEEDMLKAFRAVRKHYKVQFGGQA